MPDPKNARKHNPKNIGMLSDALRAVGAARSIVIDEHGEILAGNGVVEAAAEAGITKVKVIDADGQTIVAVRRSGLTRAQKTKLALYDNRVAELAEWDLDVLKSFAADGLDLAPYEFDAGMLEAITGVQVGLTDPDAVPAERATDIKLGDLFELGNHRLLCGDATSDSAHARLLGSDKPDAVLTDPPYGVGIDYVSFQDTEDNVSALVAKFLPLARRWPVVAVASGTKAMWLYPRPTWVLAWIHPAGMGAGPWGFNQFNPILVYGGCPYLKLGMGSRPDSVVMAVDREGVDGHPTPKPVKVWQWLVERITPSVDALLFDPFAGSGTTIVAAEQLGRRCFGIELAPSYCQVIIDRWQNFTGRKAVRA